MAMVHILKMLQWIVNSDVNRSDIFENIDFE